MADHRAIKARARREKRHVADLIALAPKNDPFYSGTPKDLASADWFADIWRRFRYGPGVHIRRVHYQILSQDPPVRMPEGEPYENTERCWRFLNAASKAARYLDRVDPAAFVDRRNPEPTVFARPAPHAHVSVLSEGDAGAFALPEFPPLPSIELKDFEGLQPYLVEIWCEKSTMNDVLVPLCEQYAANLVTGVGELSITAVLHLVRDRVPAIHKPTRILYISDFDPAGLSMPVAVARKIEYFVRQGKGAPDIHLRPVVLTESQVRQYGLPRTPIRESERRKQHFEEHHGTGATELDALEALYPGELRRIIEEEILRYFDVDLPARTETARGELEARLDALEAAARSEHSGEIAALQAEYEALRESFAGRVAQWSERMVSLRSQLRSKLEESLPDPASLKPPHGRRADEPEWILYDSALEYEAQLERYKAFQQGQQDA